MDHEVNSLHNQLQMKFFFIRSFVRIRVLKRKRFYCLCDGEKEPKSSERQKKTTTQYAKKSILIEFSESLFLPRVVLLYKYLNISIVHHMEMKMMVPGIGSYLIKSITRSR